MTDASSPSDRTTATSDSSLLGTKWVIVLLVVAIVALGASIWLWRARQPAGREVVVEMVGPDAETEAPAVYTAEVIDAINRRDVQAEVGRRYKVVIEDESKEGNAGIARIGGLVTFVRDAQVGDIAVVEVTRMKKTSAEARLVRRVETAAFADRRAVAQKPPSPKPDKPSPVAVGGVYTGVVEDVGRKGAGIVKVQGKVVFVEGAQKDETVIFRVVEDLDRFARAERVAAGAASTATSQNAGATSPELAQPQPAARPDDVRDGAVAAAEDVQAGRTFEVLVSEPDKKDPERGGVAKIGGLVVFVPGAQPGERVVIRITERRPRFAFSEVLEKKRGEASP
jgi:predicted RNA-binding protein with TRAM domain